MKFTNNIGIMFKYTLKLCIQQTNWKIPAGKLYSTSTEKWDLMTAIYVERKPIIGPVLNDIQKQYKELLIQSEFERSLQSDHEVRHEEESKQLEQLKHGDIAELQLKQTVQDLLDTSTDELTQFKFAERLTDDDRHNNQKSLNRTLDKHLVLVTEQTIGEKSFYLLPQGKWRNGETLRQTANRVLNDIFGGNIQSQFFGNAPSGFYKYKYPKKMRDQEGTTGAKIFIYFTRFNSGTLPETLNYKWLTKREMEKILHPQYYRSLSQILIDEN